MFLRAFASEGHFPSERIYPYTGCRAWACSVQTLRLIVIVDSRFIQRPQKRSRGKQLIHRHSAMQRRYVSYRMTQHPLLYFLFRDCWVLATYYDNLVKDEPGRDLMTWHSFYRPGETSRSAQTCTDILPLQRHFLLFHGYNFVHLNDHHLRVPSIAQI